MNKLKKGQRVAVIQSNTVHTPYHNLTGKVIASWVHIKTTRDTQGNVIQSRKAVNKVKVLFDAHKDKTPRELIVDNVCSKLILESKQLIKL